MNMHWIDWLIISSLLAFITYVAIGTKKHTKSVADFLAANRCAKRYLLCVAGGMGSLGAISLVAMFELYYNTGFTAKWWGMMAIPVGLFITLSGYVTYRYRETRAMTLAQFFEMRYSKKFRVYAGIVAWISGVINFGIFPAVGARFFIYFCGIPEIGIVSIGPISDISLTFASVMIFLLAISLFFVFLGGQIAVMVTDFVQGIFTNFTFLIILGILIYMFNWDQVVEALKTAPENQSLLHPLKTSKMASFNYWFFIIAVFANIYGFRAWQGSQGYACSAKTAHEARMAGILGEWRGMILALVTVMLPIGAFVIMHHPDHLATADWVNSQLANIENETIATQMTVPLTLVAALPIGIKGLLAGVMLAAFISTHDTYLHSWGSIFVQDIILPFRKKPFSTKTHLWLLKGSILFVAVFIFMFSLLFQQNEYILLFFSITGAIYIGGAGACIIGGLYWKHGHTMGAWAALTIGMIFAIMSMLIRKSWEPTVYPLLTEYAPGFLKSFTWLLHSISEAVPGINWEVGPKKFPIDSQWMYGFSIIAAGSGYIICSLAAETFGKREPHDMDRMLHRGKWAIKGEHEQEITKPVTGLKAILPTEEFTGWDKVIYYSKLSWAMLWFVIFIIGMILSIYIDFTEDQWATFWLIFICISIPIAIITVIWFTIGGIMDLKDLYHTLDTMKRDERDVGIIVDHHDLTEEPESDNH